MDQTFLAAYIKSFFKNLLVMTNVKQMQINVVKQIAMFIYGDLDVLHIYKLCEIYMDIYTVYVVYVFCHISDLCLPGSKVAFGPNVTVG